MTPSQPLIDRFLDHLKFERRVSDHTVSAYRIDLLRQAPRILFFDQGKLAADGAHHDLVESCSAYAEAYLRWEVEEANQISVLR